MLKKGLSTYFCISLFLLFSNETFAILTPVVDSIPLKDGKKMAIDIYQPAGITKGPVILIQTPYNRLFYRLGLPLGIGLNLNSSNYIIVVGDWRGFYGSKNAAYVGNPSIGEDGYSAVEWIAAQTWSNGKIGTWGPSALGRVQFQTALKNPPNLTCICPLVAAPQYDYEEYFPNGCLRTEYVEQLDALGYGLSKTLMQHTYHDATWSFVEALNYYPDSIKVPCFMIGGWYDHTIPFMLPFFNAIRSSSPVNVRDQHRLLMGPWVHGGHGTAQVGTDVQGELTYPNSANWNDSLALMYFDYHLRAISNGWDNTPFLKYYQMGENTWQASPVWPPSGIYNVDFYLHKNGLLSNTLPSQNGDSISFDYDPQDPSPTVGGCTLRADLDQGPYDQASMVENRNDLLVFSTDVLNKDIVLKGSVVVHLKVSSDKVDTDFDVRLTDVYPDGRSMLVNDGTMRMRFRNGNTQALVAMMVPGKVYDCDITLPATCITFLAGHRIRLDVSSSNYPKYNRNMNTGGNMYPGNSMDSLVNPVAAKNTVHTSGQHTSYITLPLVGFNSHVSAVQERKTDMEVWPNPATGLLNFKCNRDMNEEMGLMIFNATGALVWEGYMKAGDNTHIDIAGLLPGVYLLRAGDGRHQYTRTFVKM